jgi:hypothetical protein
MLNLQPKSYDRENLIKSKSKQIMISIHNQPNIEG